MQRDTYTCPTCRMTFRIGSPQKRPDDFGRCPHKSSSGQVCAQRFWHRKSGNNPVRVGIEPQDVPA